MGRRTLVATEYRQIQRRCGWEQYRGLVEIGGNLNKMVGMGCRWVQRVLQCLSLGGFPSRGCGYGMGKTLGVQILVGTAWFIIAL